MTMDTCVYRNTGNQMVILNCIDLESFLQEKMVFLFEDWLFRCPPYSQVYIWTDGLTGEQVLPAVGTQSLPERTTAARNKAANTSSLSIVSIGLSRMKARSQQVSCSLAWPSPSH